MRKVFVTVQILIAIALLCLMGLLIASGVMNRSINDIVGSWFHKGNAVEQSVDQAETAAQGGFYGIAAPSSPSVVSYAKSIRGHYYGIYVSAGTYTDQIHLYSPTRCDISLTGDIKLTLAGVPISSSVSMDFEYFSGSNILFGADLAEQITATEKTVSFNIKVIYSNGVKYPTAFTLNMSTSSFALTSDAVPPADVPLPTAPEKEGHTFLYWCTDEALTNRYDGETVVGDISLYAKYEINHYAITYDLNGGSGDFVQYNADWHTVLDMDKVPLREGYNFLGWQLLDGTLYSGQLIDSNMHLIAQWAIKHFTVNFIADGVVVKTIDVVWNTKFVEAMELSSFSNAVLLNLQNVVGDDLTDKASTVVVDTDLNATVSISTIDKVGLYFKRNLVAVIAFASLGIALIAISIVSSKF